MFNNLFINMLGDLSVLVSFNAPTPRLQLLPIMGLIINGIWILDFVNPLNLIV
jgi:hypothetical protein